MPKTRDEILYNRNKKYDIIIIGGGVIGATIALKTSRVGLSTLLLDKHDFSYGSSSRTSKMLTGGFNDMNGNNLIHTIHKVKERNNLMYKSSSPYFGIINPIYEYRGSGIFKEEMKAALYDVFSLFGKTKKHSSYSRNETLDALPDLISNDVIASVEYYEGLLDDSRYVIELLLKAEEYGCDLLNYAEVKAFEYNQKEIENVVFTDNITGKVYTVNAKTILIAAGAWGHSISSLLPNGNFENRIDYIKGSHLVIDSDLIHINKSVVLPKIKSRANVFLMRWKNSTIIGPTIKKNINNLDCIYTASDEAEYLLDVYNTYFSSIVNKNHIITTQSGMMPLNPYQFKIHSHPQYKLFLVEGGNFTTSSSISIRTLIKMYGKPYKWFSNQKVIRNKFDTNTELVLNEKLVKFLIDYFGSVNLILKLNELCKNDSSLLAETGLDYRINKGLIKYFIETEHAMHLDDIMMRRFRFILTENDCGTLISEHIAQEMADILKWDKQRTEWEIKRYRTEIKRARVALY
ncbi:FAD-dependent oxidoreductase [uncultured Brachyspira sp.]|mgnify:FL=1|uniref:FAD-dependent oxidoreductase n=1 Tax=uncultured Brachyspira sp. TaxID=221953 RepID=UPI0025D175B2|nr:FAD-dependent oxidoreductase [uncultured Brachyspira sp.]